LLLRRREISPAPRLRQRQPCVASRACRTRRGGATRRRSRYAPLGARSEPLVHAPEALQSAGIGGVGVMDDAVLEHERTHAHGANRSPNASPRTLTQTATRRRYHVRPPACQSLHPRIKPSGPAACNPDEVFGTHTPNPERGMKEAPERVCVTGASLILAYAASSEVLGGRCSTHHSSPAAPCGIPSSNSGASLFLKFASCQRLAHRPSTRHAGGVRTESAAPLPVVVCPGLSTLIGANRRQLLPRGAGRALINLAAFNAEIRGMA
jgi:hypothetical protein